MTFASENTTISAAALATSVFIPWVLPSRAGETVTSIWSANSPRIAAVWSEAQSTYTSSCSPGTTLRMATMFSAFARITRSSL